MPIQPRYILSAVIFICLSTTSYAQNNNSRESIEIHLGYSENGSGDLPGMMIATEYRNYIKRRLFFTVGLGANIHHGDFPIFYTTPSGNDRDGSVREVTAGFQLQGTAGWDFIKTARHSAGIAAGPMLRYQASAAVDMMSIYYPAATNMPFPLVLFDHREKQRILSAGGIAQLSYRYSPGRRLVVGVVGSFQNDTNSDVILQAGASVGIRL